MEINIEDVVIKYLFEYAISNSAGITFNSLDEQDYGRVFTVLHKDIISIEDDVYTDEKDCLMIWWKQWSPLEGNYITNSNHFTNFTFVD